MKRLTNWLVAGFLLAPQVGSAQGVPEATTGFQVPFTNDHTGLCYKTCAALDACAGTTYHPGIDFNGAGNDCDLDVGAVGIGIVRDVCSGAPDCTDTDANWGSVVIEHNWKGETWYSQYGHMKQVLVTVGATVSKGQVIGQVGAVGATSCHLHWEIREADHPNPTNASYWSCSGFLSQTTVEDWYEDPVAFVGTHGPYSAYVVSNVYHNAADTTVAPGSVLNFYVRYQNNGSGVWKNSGVYTDVDRVELESCDPSGNPVTSFLVPVGWLTSVRVKSFDSNNPDGPTVAKPERAVFTFQAQVPLGIPDQVQDVWFRPTHDGGVTMDGWVGQYFRIRVVNPPGGPCPGRDIPSTCVPSTTCYPAVASNLQPLPDATSAEWSSIGQPVRESIRAEGKYSIGFEYRAHLEADFKLGLGSQGSGAGLGVVFNQAHLPAGNGDWRPFWSAPFWVSDEQMRDFPRLQLVTSRTSGIEIRNVRLVQMPL